MNDEYYDVVIIGAGLSGIGAACHLSTRCPGKRYLILEGRDTLGGTWDLFRYPGIRSDSDMFTLGYNFKPWTSEQSLADGPDILNYIKEAAAQYGVLDKIRYGAKVQSVEWDSADATWTLTYEDKVSGKVKKVCCNFINSCTGYFNYEHGYEAQFKGREEFQGPVIHPQQWPENLDYKNKRVVVIGSGATAVTLVPALSDEAAHVTMLQRSPTYMAVVPSKAAGAERLRRFLSEKRVYRIIRTRKVASQSLFYFLSRRYPDRIKKLLLTDVEQRVGPDTDMKHFTPSYKPWDERVCAVKSGDLFRALRKGKVSVVTDHIDSFSAEGIKLTSGDELPADIIVTATGLDLKFFGGIDIIVDGEAFEYTRKMAYKGFMLEALPNIGFSFGYTNSSWTLKTDLTNEYFCRLLNYMDTKVVQKVMPVNDDNRVITGDFLGFRSGYIQRSLKKFPRIGSKYPWRLIQSYPVDLLLLRLGRLDDGRLRFSQASAATSVVRSEEDVLVASQ